MCLSASADRVHDNLAMTEWRYRVYVIQLRATAGPRDYRRLPWLYVGQSSKSPEDRFAQHLRGGLYASRVVCRHGWRLRPELYEDLPSYDSQILALAAERKRAERLRDAGHAVRSNGEWERAPGHALKPFTREELEPIVDTHLDRAIFSVVTRIAAPVTSEVCARILHGDGAHEATSRIPLGGLYDYGSFAHAGLDVLLGRVNELIRAGYLRTKGGTLVLPR